MKPFRDPRLLIALILLLVAVVFLSGSMRLIRGARAAEQSASLARSAMVQAGTNRGVVEPAADRNEAAPVPPAQATPALAVPPGDTSGIIALAIVIVITIILGAVIGVRRGAPGKNSSK